MAQLTSLGFFRHVRGEPTSFLMHLKDGRRKQAGRGVSFWFAPLGTSLVEVPLDDRDTPFLFHARSRDFQEVVVQGVVSWRVSDPEVLAARVDFSLDTTTGLHQHQPLDRMAAVLTRLAQELAFGFTTRAPLPTLLDDGLERLRELLAVGLQADEGLAQMGVSVVAVRVQSLAPTAEMEKALQMPAREKIQQRADEATFQRRALAVEKERAISENELQNQIELARREEDLITQRGLNARRDAEEKAAADKVESQASADKRRLAASAQADATQLVEKARNTAERERMDIYKDLPNEALIGLAARELAGKLHTIEHLNITPDMIGPLLERVLRNGAARLDPQVPGEKGA
jgi:regulator of protease activity HflC (stomatin/prohibitin superfamily)